MVPVYGIKYYCEFLDRNLLHWKIDFLFPDYNESDGMTELVASGDDCLRWEFDNESDKCYDPIRASGATLTCIAIVDFGLFDLYSIEERYVKVNIYNIDDAEDSSGGTSLFWTGWVKGKDYEEQFEPDNHTTQIAFNDGLSDLKDIIFDNYGVYYSGHRRETQILFDILSKIGYSEFIESINIYEQDMLDSVDDSPLEQAYLDTYVFQDKTCWEVLEQIVFSYKAIIRQREGIFHIFRPENSIEVSGSLYARHFTGTTTKTSVVYTHQPNEIRSIPGGIRMMVSPVKKVKIIQNSGNRESWLDNYNFKNDTFTFISTLSGYSITNWTRNGAVLVVPSCNLIPRDDMGCIIMSCDIYPTHTKYISQIFGEGAKATSDKFKLEIEYALYNTGDTLEEDIVFYIEIKDVAETNWLHAQLVSRTSTDDAHWELSQQYIMPSLDAPPGLSDWNTFERIVPGLPADGPYQISVFSLYQETHLIYVFVKSIKFYTYSTTLSLQSSTRIVPRIYRKTTIFGSQLMLGEKEIYYFPTEPKQVIDVEYIAENDIKGIESTFDVVIGDVIDEDIDNIPYQFAGAIVLNTGTPAVRVDYISLEGTTGQILITVNGESNYLSFDTDLNTTAQNFIDNEGDKYLPIVVSRTDSTLVFTGPSAGYDFTGESRVTQILANLDGDVTQGEAYVYDFEATSAWAKQGESTYKALLQIIVDEIAILYRRPKLLIQVPTIELTKQLSIDLIESFWNVYVLYDGRLCLFYAQRGEFSARTRKWVIDLFEVDVGEVVDSSFTGVLTADTTTTTADNTVITVDNG